MGQLYDPLGDAQSELAQATQDFNNMTANQSLVFAKAVVRQSSDEIDWVKTNRPEKVMLVTD